MKRRQLVELEDLPWFPRVLRDGGTAFLAFAERLSGHGRMMVEPIERALAATGETHLVDLCSGGGGPALAVADELNKRGYPVTLTLTDLYPNKAAFEVAESVPERRVECIRHPVNAVDVPKELAGMRTIFNAFHHFPPDMARQVLANAVEARRPIAVVEVVSRELPMLIGLLMAPLTVTLSMPLWRPFRWSWIPLTWLVPLMQPFVLWDGLVSWLRIYSEEELRGLVASIDAPDWHWEIGRIRLGGAPIHGTYLVGRPKGETTP